MFLSTDACAEFDWFPPELVERTAPNRRSTYILDGVVPALRAQLDAMLVRNPRGWLGGAR